MTFSIDNIEVNNNLSLNNNGFSYNINTLTLSNNGVIYIGTTYSTDYFLLSNYNQQIYNKILLSSDNNIVDATKIYGYTISSIAPNIGESLVYDGTEWITTTLFGITGPQGPTGSIGYTGSTGSQGIAGIDGDIYQTTSLSTIVIPNIGSTTSLIIGTNLSYTPNQTIIVSSVADPLDHFHAFIISYDYNSGVIVAECTDTDFSGETYSSG